MLRVDQDEDQALYEILVERGVSALPPPPQGTQGWA